MLTMSQPLSNSIASSPRRFLLVPEEQDRIPVAAPRIRRYRLASVNRRAGFAGSDLLRAQSATDAGRFDKSSR
jgi:hypothetical protein